MKKFIALVTLLIASNASATCFKFINGQGPDRIGNFAFAAKATQACVENVSSFSSASYTEVTFADAQGALAVVSGQRNGANIFVQSGNINGSNVELNGTLINVSVQEDAHLRIVKGVISVKAGRDFPQQYLVVGQ